MDNHYSPLLTDQYQLVMACGYWQLKMAERPAVFSLFFRRLPFQNTYAVCCGLANAIDFLLHWRFSTSDLDYLSSLRTLKNTPLFMEDFLTYLSNLRFSGHVDAIPEGQLIFPQEPVLRIQGPLLQCQILETALVNFMQFSSLIATKASMVCETAQPQPVVEFGLRRAQGPDGGLMASRAAFVGGCVGTSNVLAGQRYGIPVKGTQAHSWIMAFPDESEAFARFVQTMPHSSTLLVDTYHTERGINHAITIGKQLRAQGETLQAIRLDSGDLAALSKLARQLLDEAGLSTTQIMASGDLDEQRISQLKKEGACVDLWGVGTRLVTAYDHPALDMVYKLMAIQQVSGAWEYKLKISDSVEKSTIPGIQQVRRFWRQEKMLGDVIYDAQHGLSPDVRVVQADHSEDLLIPIFREGERVYQPPTLLETQAVCRQQVQRFAKSQLPYPVQVDTHLQMLKAERIKNYLQSND